MQEKGNLGPQMRWIAQLKYKTLIVKEISTQDNCKTEIDKVDITDVHTHRVAEKKTHKLATEFIRLMFVSLNSS